jgi:hypothetical protein
MWTFDLNDQGWGSNEARRTEGAVKLFSPCGLCLLLEAPRHFSNKWESSTSLGFFGKARPPNQNEDAPPLASCLWGAPSGLRAAHNPQLSKQPQGDWFGQSFLPESNFSPTGPQLKAGASSFWRFISH